MVGRRIAALVLSAVLAATPLYSNNTQNTTPSTGGLFEREETIAYKSNRFAGYYPPGKASALYDITPAFTLTAENERLALYVNQDSLAIRILNKETGYIWSSDTEIPEEDKVNDKWRAFMFSGVTVEYYSLKENATETKPTEESFLESGKSTASITLLENGFRAAVFFGGCGIGISFDVVLNSDDISILMEHDRITESESTKLVSVQFFPFLGAVRHGTQSGYFFVPDGDGALINFNSVYKTVATHYEKPYYGTDRGIAPYTNDANRVPAQPELNYNVYGIIHGVQDNGCMVEIESGASFAELLVYPAGVRTNFYFISNRYNFRQQYTHIVSSGAQATLITPEMASFDIHERITLLSGERADYSGIAAVYREHLAKDGRLVSGPASSAANIPMTLYTVGSAVNEGMFWNSSVSMTSLAEAEEIVDDLNASGVYNIRLAYMNGFKNNVTGRGKDRYKVQASLSGDKTMAETSRKLSENGNLFILYNSPFVTHGKVGDLDTKDDVIRKINKEYVVSDDRFGAVLYKQHYLNAQGAAKLVDLDMTSARNLSADGVMFWLMSAASSFNAGVPPVWREEAVQEIAESLHKAGETGYLAMERMGVVPAYFGAADSINGIEMNTSLYMYVTDTVPFTALVLRGSAELYSVAMNNSPSPVEERLRLIEWGIYPSFIVTHEESSKMLYSDIWEVVSSQYAVWKDDIVAVYTQSNGMLKHVEGAGLQRHNAIAPGVIKADYDNGVSIYVNYTGQDYQAMGIMVPAMGSAVTA